MMKVNWVVDTNIIENRDNVDDLLPAVKKSGANLYTTKYIPFSDKIDYGPKHFQLEPTILYGSVNFVKRCHIPYTPGAWGYLDVMNTDHYYSYVPNEWLLNEKYVIFPFYKVQNDIDYIFSLIGEDRFFLRPISGFKTFTGLVIDRDNYLHEFNSSQQITSVIPETLCLVAPVSDIQGEFRFVIGNGEVIDGSEYRWDDILDIRHDYPDECYQLAKKMACYSWQPDVVYTCDVALTERGSRIVELNSFSCAGLYACDKQLVVNRLNEIAVKEFNGDI